MSQRGRPPLRVGERGNITRTEVAPGVWTARCYYRDSDGVTRRLFRRSPRGVFDRHGKSAENELISHITDRAKSSPESVSGLTLVSDLLETHLKRLEKAGRAPRTLDTYRARVEQWVKVGKGLRVQDCSPGVITRQLDKVRVLHGDTTAKQLRTLLVAAFDIAVVDGALSANPVRATAPPPTPRKSTKGRGAVTLDRSQLPDVMKALMDSEECKRKDLTDLMLTHLGTGLRVSEVCGLRWKDFDPDARTLSVCGRVVRAKGKGLLWTPIDDSSKGAAPTISVPAFLVAALLARSTELRVWGPAGLIFPTSTGTMRDPNIVARQWRGVRETLGEHLEKSTGHSFRKTLGTLVADSTSDPRIAADVLGHSDVATTLRHYLQRGRTHSMVADLLDEAVNGSKDDDDDEG